MQYNYEFKFKADGSNSYQDLPYPREDEGAFIWGLEEVCTQDTKRSEDATMNKKVIKKKRALTVKYTNLPHSQYARLVNIIKGSGNGGTSIDVINGHLIYPDPENLNSPNSEIYVYTGNLEASSIGHRDYDTGELLISVTVKFIEN